MTVDYLLHQREYNLPFSMPIKTLSLHIYLPFSLGPHFAFATQLLGLYAASVPLHPHVIFLGSLPELHKQSIRGVLLPTIRVALCSL